MSDAGDPIKSMGTAWRGGIFVAMLAVWTSLVEMTVLGSWLSRTSCFFVAAVVRLVGIPCGQDQLTLYVPGKAWEMVPPFDGRPIVGFTVALVQDPRIPADNSHGWREGRQ